VLVSTNLADEDFSAAILDLAANKKILLFVSPATLAEYEEVLRRPRLKLDQARIADSQLREESTEISCRIPVSVLISGPNHLARASEFVMSSSWFRGNPALVVQRHEPQMLSDKITTRQNYVPRLSITLRLFVRCTLDRFQPNKSSLGAF
jgi:hypothetical protein